MLRHQVILNKILLQLKGIWTWNKITHNKLQVQTSLWSAKQWVTLALEKNYWPMAPGCLTEVISQILFRNLLRAVKGNCKILLHCFREGPRSVPRFSFLEHSLINIFVILILDKIFGHTKIRVGCLSVIYECPWKKDCSLNSDRNILLSKSETSCAFVVKPLQDLETWSPYKEKQHFPSFGHTDSRTLLRDKKVNH